MDEPRSDERGPLGEVTRLFLKLGTVGFGGPAAHIAMMDDEVVERRKWLSRQRFLDLVGATNLIPGPNSTEMAIHVGYLRAGLPGLLLAGTAFIVPAVIIMLAFAWAYVEYGSLPHVAPLLVGIRPAVVAVIGVALWRLGRTAVKGVYLAVVGIAVAAAALAGLNLVLALLGGALLGGLLLLAAEPGRRAAVRERLGGTGAWLPVGLLGLGWPGWALLQVATREPVQLWRLGLFFLKVGAVLYGSGYVLVAFLEGELVGELGWLTQAELLDAIALGQFTPGPVLTTATFIGYVVAGWPGALVATVAIFLPSFVFVLLLNPIVAKLRGHPVTAAFLDAVNVSAVGLMGVVVLRLSLDTLVTPAAIGLAVVALGLGTALRINAAWLVLSGAVVGYVLDVGLGMPVG